MEVFNYILVMLAAVLISNLINRFLPLLSVPIIQIILGVLIAIIPYGMLSYEIHLTPDLFFVLFLSPLVFHSARMANLQTMQRLIKPIIMAAIGLVLLTVFAVGYFTHLLIPAIPLVAAFALAAALGPTDIVAVEAVAHRIKMPSRIVSILTGESIINDATGIVCFQFAIVAAATGSFNVLYGLGRFIVLALGGLLVGTIITVLKFALIRLLRSLNINAASLHISIGILTPFLIYMVAEGLETSGILAVFSSGIVHAMYKDKLNPEVLSLNNATENIWSFLAFSLDGLVFVLLGTQLPGLLRVEIGWASGLAGRQIAIYVILIYLAMAATRFIWWVLTVRRKTYDDPVEPISVIRSSLIFSIAGARGAVSMASILSIPLLLSSGADFPERDLIILVTCGVITISLLMTNFILPLFVTKSPKTDGSLHDKEQATRIEILNTVIERLRESITPENVAATEIIIHHYYARLNKRFSSERNRNSDGKRKHFGIRSGLLLFEKDVILHMAESGQLSESQAEHYLKEADRLYEESNKKIGPFKAIVWLFKHLYSSFTWKDTMPHTREMRILKEVNEKMMREKQEELNLDLDDEILKLITAEHEQVVSARMGIAANNISEHMAHEVNEVAENGLYMERLLIQQMMEAGRLSPKTAKEMQANIILLEAQLHAE